MKQFKNQSAPLVPAFINDELKNIGGLVPFGAYFGQPVYRLAWGQSEEHYSRGRMRLRFPNVRIPAVTTQERFFVHPTAYSRIARWIETRDSNRLEKVLQGDFSVLGHVESLSSFLIKDIHPKLWYQMPSVVAPRSELNRNLADIARTEIVPSNWIYIPDITQTEQIGKPLFYVLRWTPPDDELARREWERARYTRDAYVPELNAVVGLIDDLGPYPKGGTWKAIIEIADYETDIDGEPNPRKWSYAAPTEENCLIPIRELHQEYLEEREQARKASKQNYIANRVAAGERAANETQLASQLVQ